QGDQYRYDAEARAHIDEDVPGSWFDALDDVEDHACWRRLVGNHPGRCVVDLLVGESIDTEDARNQDIERLVPKFAAARAMILCRPDVLSKFAQQVAATAPARLDVFPKPI